MGESSLSDDDANDDDDDDEEEELVTTGSRTGLQEEAGLMGTPAKPAEE